MLFLYNLFSDWIILFSKKFLTFPNCQCGLNIKIRSNFTRIKVFSSDSENNKQFLYRINFIERYVLKDHNSSSKKSEWFAAKVNIPSIAPAPPPVQATFVTSFLPSDSAYIARKAFCDRWSGEAPGDPWQPSYSN